MELLLLEQEIEVSAVAVHAGLLTHLRHARARHVSEGFVPVRFVLTATSPSGYHCEFGAISGLSVQPRRNGRFG